MKRLALAALALIAVGIGLWLARPAPAPDTAHNEPSANESGLAVVTDGVEIFQKVLWREPQPDDRILHAERRQWSEGGSLTRWQWFLHVQAGKDLIAYLRDANAFGLVATDQADISDAPTWFPKDHQHYEIQRAGQLVFLFRKGSDEFYASSQGKGFTKPLPAPPPAPVATPQPQGRIPNTPPPNPQ